MMFLDTDTYTNTFQTSHFRTQMCLKCTSLLKFRAVLDQITTCSYAMYIEKIKLKE
jgi:hypothetical protein